MTSYWSPTEARGSIKAVFIGDVNCGKTSFYHKMIHGMFAPVIPTIGVNYNIYKLDNWKLCLWDTGGQEKYRSLTKMYYRGSAVIFLVYDITRRSTFDNIKSYWLPAINREFGEILGTDNNIHLPIIVLIANKSDLEDQRQVATREGQKLAISQKCLFWELSVMNDSLDNYLDILSKLLDKYVDECNHPPEVLGFLGVHLIPPQKNSTSCCRSI